MLLFLVFDAFNDRTLVGDLLVLVHGRVRSAISAPLEYFIVANRLSGSTLAASLSLADGSQARLVKGVRFKLVLL